MQKTEVVTPKTQDCQLIHTFPSPSSRVQAKIKTQLQVYLSIKDEALPKFKWKWQNKGSQVQLSLKCKKPNSQSTLRQLISDNKFSRTSQEIITIFIKLCRAVQKMHKVGIPHMGLASDRLYLSGNTITLPLPAFNLIQKAKKSPSKTSDFVASKALHTYESIDVVQIGIILMEMLTKSPIDLNQMDQEKLRHIVKTVKTTYLRDMLEGMVLKQQKITIFDVLSIVRKEQINPQVTSAQKEKQQRTYHFPLFSFFSFNHQTMPNTQNYKSKVVKKEWKNFQISMIRLPNTFAIYFEAACKNTQLILKHLYRVDTINRQFKQFFKGIDCIFSRLQNPNTSLGMSESGQLIMIFTQPQKQQRSAIRTKNHIAQRQIQQNQQLLQKQRRVQSLLTTFNKKRQEGMQSRLKAVQQLIKQSRCLSEGSHLIKSVQLLWKLMLRQVLSSQNLQDLFTLIGICDKYWLQCDQIKNLMKKRVTQLIQVGLWRFQL